MYWDLTYEDKLVLRNDYYIDTSDLSISFWERNIFVSIRSAVTSCFCGNTNGGGASNPLFYREYKIVAACRIFNCTEFGIIKIGIIRCSFCNFFGCVFGSPAKPCVQA
jgi:hypothetical protein